MPNQFRNLVFEGGGVKGIAYAGAIEVLEAKNVMPDIVRVGGTSAGAITACLLALGAKSADIASIVGGTHFRDFMDDSFGVIRDTKRLLEDFGWYKGEAFSQWIRTQIYAFTGKFDLTFRQLAQRKKEEPQKPFRDLYVVGTGLSIQLPEVLSAETTPDMPIWRAVRISMSIPLFFAAVKEAGQVHVDGGVTWNYPIDLFDDRKFLSDPTDQKLFVEVSKGADKYPTAYDDNHVYNKETLGFRVDTKDEIKAEREGWRRPPKDIDDILDYVKALVSFMMEMANDAHLHKNDWHRTVFLDALGVRATDFNLPDAKVTELVQSGRDGANEYFDWFKNGEEKPLNKAA